MTRRKARENAFIALFEASFGEDMESIIAAGEADDAEHAIDEYGKSLLKKYRQHAEEVNGRIEPKLKGWTVNRLPRVSLAILRLAVVEMFYSEEEMDSVAINEAVEMTKKYGDESDYQFVNGVLGSLSREKGRVTKALENNEQTEAEEIQ